MNKDYMVFITHILESMEKIKSFCGEISKEEFFKDEKLQEAVIRKLEIIGEAVKNLPNNLKKKYLHIEWMKIAGMRDKLIHHYFGINLGIVWDVIKEDLPKLKENIENILVEEKKTENKEDKKKNNKNKKNVQ